MSTSLSTLGEIKAEFVVRMNSATTVAYFTDTLINNWEVQAHGYASSYKKWPMTEARVSTTFASFVTDEDGFPTTSYPEGWKSDSIRMLQIGGKTYNKQQFFSFRKYLEDNASASDKVYSDFGRRIYVNGGASASGTVALWGQYTPIIDVTDPSGLTVFSGHEEDGNLAMVELMMSYALTKEKKEKEAEIHFQRAVLLLDGIWKRIGDEQFEYQTAPSDGMFKRVDVVGGAYRDDLYKRDQFL